MKSAKIGQLTPISDRLLPTDRSDPHKALSQPPGGVQQAWLCRGDQILVEDGGGEYNCLGVCHKVNSPDNEIGTRGGHERQGGYSRLDTQCGHDRQLLNETDIHTKLIHDDINDDNVHLFKRCDTNTLSHQDEHVENEKYKTINIEDFKLIQAKLDPKLSESDSVGIRERDLITNVSKINTNLATNAELSKDNNTDKVTNIHSDILKDISLEITHSELVQDLIAEIIPQATSECNREFDLKRIVVAKPDRGVSPQNFSDTCFKPDSLNTSSPRYPEPGFETNSDPQCPPQSRLCERQCACKESSLRNSAPPRTNQIYIDSQNDRAHFKFVSAQCCQENSQRHRNRRPCSFTSSLCNTNIESCTESSELDNWSRFIHSRRNAQQSGRLEQFKMSSQEKVYINNSRDSKSPSSSEVSVACSCHSKRNEQILSVCRQDLHDKRLSHQYLNSSVTGHKYPFIFSDTGVLDSPNVHSEMIFNAAKSKERPNPESIPGELAPHSIHHYYNKSSMFQPVVREHNSSFTSNMGEKKKNKDFDLSIFIPLAQMKCPFSKLSDSSEQPFNRQHSTKYQQFSSQDNWEEHTLLRAPEAVNYLLAQRLEPGVSSSVYTSFSQSTLIQHLTCGHRRISFSPVSLLWAFLSVLVAATCLLSFLTPFWAVHPDHIHSFGLLNLCVRDQRFSHPRSICVNFGYQQLYSYRNLNNETEIFPYVVDTPRIDITRIPSGAWQAACLLFGAGVSVQILGAAVSLVVLTLSEPWHRRVAMTNGYVQTVGVLLLLSGLVLYPIGFSSPFFSYFCDSTRAFRTGHCAMGWSYITAVMATALSIFCPVISNFAEAQMNKEKPVARLLETARLRV
uniref:Uncharacterized protein n=1 Tax=Biomphalaria glabrata TaxID=6526 RepID=A0A2C9L2L7_BIOGL